MPPPDDAAYRAADTSVPLRDGGLGDLLLEVADAVPTRPAVQEWSTDDAALRTTTYAELAARALATARTLTSMGAPGETVALRGANSTAWLVVEYATALAGMVLLPLDPALTEAETRALLARSPATVLLTDRRFRDRDLLAEAHRLQGGPQRVVDLADVTTAGADATVPSTPRPPVDPHAPYLLAPTSGTTGTPKIAVLSQHAVANIGVLSPPLLGVGDGPVWVNPMPLHHVGGSVCVAMSVLAARGTVVLTVETSPERILDLLARTRGVVIGAVPTMLSAMLDHPRLAEHDLAALEVVQIGGSTVPPALIARTEAVLGARVVNAYGQSEAPSACQTRLDDTDLVKASTVGRPGLHREACVRDPAGDATVGFGVRGELALRSPLTTTAYLGDPEGTAAVRDDDGWLRTGDLAAMAPDGTVTLHGRLREVIIRGGENIDPTEVEAVLRRHPAVADVAVVGAPDAHWGEQVAAFVQWRAGAAVAWAEIEAHARVDLAGFKVPRVWHAVTDFPRTAAGKIRKFRLREQLA